MDCAILEDHRVKLKESEKRDRYQDLVRELKKLWNTKVTVMPNVIGVLGTIPKGLEKVLGDLELGGQVGDYLDYSIIKIDQNTEKTPCDLRRLAVTQTPVKNLCQKRIVAKFH